MERMVLVKHRYKGVIFDDVVVEPEGTWSQICRHCVKKHGISKSVLDFEAGYGICGVEGCENEADHYIDFPKGELQEIRYLKEQPEVRQHQLCDGTIVWLASPNWQNNTIRLQTEYDDAELPIEDNDGEACCIYKHNIIPINEVWQEVE